MTESAVERLTEKAKEHEWVDVHPFDLRLLLSERAELLAAVERMRGALEEAADSFARIKDYVGGRNIDFASAFVRADRGEKHARAALTTGEGK